MSERDPLGGWYAGPHGQHYREVGVLRLVAAHSGEWGVTVWVDGRRRFADRGRADDMAGAKAAAESWVRDFAQGLLEAMGDE